MRSQRVGTVVGIAAVAGIVAAGVASGGDEPPAATITGTPMEGETLTAEPGTNFKWQRCLPAPDQCGEERHAPGWTDIGVNAQSYVLTQADVDHLVRVLAKDTSLGTIFAPSPPVGPIAAAPEPPPPPPVELRAEEPPIFHKTGNVEPKQGTVEVQLPNGETHEIHRVTQIPVDSIVDVSNGHAILTTQSKPGGPLQSTEEWGAAFKFEQKNKGTITKLTLTDPIGGSTHREASERRSHRRGLWGRGRCNCRTSGQNSSGTARGTFYLVKETDEGTFTKVKHGKVLVKNFNNGKKVLLKKGDSYLARDKRRP